MLLLLLLCPLPPWRYQRNSLRLLLQRRHTISVSEVRNPSRRCLFLRHDPLYPRVGLEDPHQCRPCRHSYPGVGSNHHSHLGGDFDQHSCPGSGSGRYSRPGVNYGRHSHSGVGSGRHSYPDVGSRRHHCSCYQSDQA